MEEGSAMEGVGMGCLLRTLGMVLQAWVVVMAWEDMVTEVEREPTKNTYQTVIQNIEFTHQSIKAKCIHVHIYSFVYHDAVAI